MPLFDSFIFVTLFLFSFTEASSISKAIHDGDLLQPRSAFAKRFPPLASDDDGSGPHVSRVVARSIVIVFLIFIFLIVSLLLLRKCRPTFPRNRRIVVRPPSTPPHTIPPLYGAYGPPRELQNKRTSKASIESDASTVVVNQLDYLPSPPSLQKPSSTYNGGGKVNIPAVGFTNFR